MKLKIVVLIVALAGAFFLLIALGSVVKSVRIRKHGVFTESTVLKSVHRSIKSPVRNVSVSFNTPDGSQVTGTASTRQFVSTGDKIRIWYDPAFPQKIDFGDTIGYNMRGVIAGGIVFLFGFYYFIKYSSRDRANKTLIESGMKIAAEFVSVNRNEKYRMGDNNPWVIKCKWTDNIKNLEYFFTSKDYTIDPTPYLNGRLHIDVFIDPADPGKYFMDTSFMPKGNNTIG
jgi:hypothetical protein